MDPAYGLEPVGNGQAAMGLTAAFAAVLTGLEGTCATCPTDGIAGFTTVLVFLAGLRGAFFTAAFLFFAAVLRPAFFFTDFFFTAGILAVFFLAGFFAAFFTFFLVAIFKLSIKN